MKLRAVHVACAFLVVASSCRASWSHYYDGSTLPGPSWSHFGEDWGVPVPLDQYNWGLQITNEGTYALLLAGQTQGTLGVRFRLESPATSDYDVLGLVFAVTGGSSPPVLIHVSRTGLISLGLYDPHQPLPAAQMQIPCAYSGLADLGPAVPGEFHEALVYADSATGRVVCSWDGVMAYNAVPTEWWSVQQSVAGFGISREVGPITGANSVLGAAEAVTFDWVGYAPENVIPEPSGSLALLSGIAGLSMTLLRGSGRAGRGQERGRQRRSTGGAGRRREGTRRADARSLQPGDLSASSQAELA